MDDIKEKMAQIDHAAMHNKVGRSGHKRWVYANGKKYTEAEWNEYRAEHYPSMGMRIIMAMPTGL